MPKPCLITHWYDNKTNETYVNMKDAVGIRTQQDLLKVCSDCDKYLSCDYVLRLFTLLSVNKNK